MSEGFNYRQFGKTLLTVLGLGLPLAIGAAISFSRNPVQADYAGQELADVKENDPQEREIHDAIPEAPHFKLADNSCSGYVRLAAKELFGKGYTAGSPESDAWNRRYNDKLIAEIQEPLADYIESRELEPGMVIGVFYPDSKYLNHRDETGQKVKYTHNVLYLGSDDENGNGKIEGNEAYFAHQFGSKIERFTLDEMAEKHLFPREIIDSWN